MKFDEAMSILYVEDDEIDIECLRRSFHKNGIKNQLFIANDGQAALDMLRSNDPALSPQPKIALVDVNTPRINGLEFLAEVRKDPALRELMVIMLTTSDRESDIKRAAEGLAAGYIVKPASASGLHAAVGRLKELWEISEFKPDHAA